MKKSTMIILIVILISMILLIPNNEVKAINLNGVDVEIPVDITTNAFIIANNTYYKDSSNKLYEYVAISYESLEYTGFYYNSSHDKLYIRPADNSQWLNASHWLYDGSQWILNSVNSGAWYMYLDNIFYSNVDIIQYDRQEVVYESDELAINLSINISSNFACDLDGRDMEYVTIDFSDYQNENYVYQYGIKRQINSDIVWYDIELSNGIYNFNEYYNNTIIYARVLDNVNNEVALSEYKIDNSELPKFEMLITSNIACPVPNYDNDPLAELIQIDLTNCYNDDYIYQYSYDSKNYHTLNVNQGQMIYYLNEYLGLHIDFRIIDKNNNKIYFTYGNRTNENITDYDKDRGKVFYNEGISCDLEGNKIINITMDFSNITKFINEYNFNVVINGVSYGEIQYKEISLNRDNYQQFYDVKVYVDNIVVYSKKYTIGYLVDGTPIDGSHDELDFDNMYDEILDSYIEDLDINVKDTKSMKELFISFLSAVSAFIAIFFDLLIYAFESLNVWLRACIVCLFIIYIITKIVKVARRK